MCHSGRSGESTDRKTEKMQKLDGPSLPPRSDKAKQLVIFLHGYGANGADLLNIGEEWGETLKDAAFVSPNACETCDSFSAGFQWFPIRAISPEAIEREKRASTAGPVLSNFIDEQLQKWGVDESALAVAGFSQGAMMAMYTMPRRKKPCAGIIGYSGMILDAQGLKAPGVVKMPVLAIHGDADQIVPPENLPRIEKAFSEAGFEIEAIMRPGLGHGIDQFGLIRGLQFLQESFEKSAETFRKQAKA
jgi:phospholipase/carboxylesterase